MPEWADYQVWLCDWTGDKVLQLFPGDDLLSLTWSHAINEPGIYELKLSAETTTHDSFRKHYGVLIDRDYGDGQYEEFYGFHLGLQEEYVSGDVDEHYWYSYGLSPEWLLSLPLLWPVENVNPNWVFYDVWWAHGTADDIIKQMASESMGGGAATARQLSSFTVEGNESLGTWSCYEGRFEPLSDVMQGYTGEQYQVDYRVVRIGGGFELRTYSPYYGTDRRRGTGNETIFSTELENMMNPVWKEDWSEEVTALVGGGQGGGMEQPVYFAEDADALAESPYSRREGYMDLRDAQPDTIPDIMQQELYNRRKLVSLGFDLIQTSACLYGRDWQIGDLCTAVWKGADYDVRVTQAGGRIDGKENEEIVGRAELWTRQDVI